MIVLKFSWNAFDMKDSTNGKNPLEHLEYENQTQVQENLEGMI